MHNSRRSPVPSDLREYGRPDDPAFRRITVHRVITPESESVVKAVAPTRTSARVEARLKRFVELYKANWTWVEIERALGVSRGTVQNLYKSAVERKLIEPRETSARKVVEKPAPPPTPAGTLADRLASIEARLDQLHAAVERLTYRPPTIGELESMTIGQLLDALIARGLVRRDSA